MVDYYGHAILTINSDSAEGDHEGFLEQVRKDNASFDIVDSIFNERVGIRHPRLNSFGERITRSFIHDRAWTPQEYLLSPRSLLYTANELMWYCQARTYFEHNANSQHDSLNVFAGHHLKRGFLRPRQNLGCRIVEPPDGNVDDSLVERWFKLVDEYDRRCLTFATDRLPAISGIAREIHQQTGHTYVAGLWAETLHLGLLWDANRPKRRTETYPRPSWSWVSLPSKSMSQNASLSWILFPYKVHQVLWKDGVVLERLERRVQLSGHTIESKSGDPYGEVTSGSLCLRSKQIPLKEWRGDSRAYFDPTSMDRLSLAEFYDANLLAGLDQLVCYFDFPEDRIDEATLEQTLIFQVMTWAYKEYIRPPTIDTKGAYGEVITFALLIRPAPDAPAGTYERIGSAEVPNVNGLAEDGWGMRTINLV